MDAHMMYVLRARVGWLNTNLPESKLMCIVWNIELHAEEITQRLTKSLHKTATNAFLHPNWRCTHPTLKPSRVT